MIVYGIKTCDTCRKAVKTLRDARLHDVRESGLPPEVLARALDRFGADLVNTRSATWRALAEDARALPAADLIAAHPTVMKRPLIERDGALYLGWSGETRASLGVR